MPRALAYWPFSTHCISRKCLTSKKIDTALYADDTALYTAFKCSNTIVKRLNSALIILQQYFAKWKIKLNEAKSRAILFPFNRKRIRTPTIPMMNGQHTIDLAESKNYLGVTFDKMLLFRHHISNTINKTNKCMRALFPLIVAKSQLSTPNKVLIFSAILRPLMSYGCPVWSSAAITHTNKLIAMQNKLPMRTLTIFLSEITDFPSLKKFIEKLNVNSSNNCLTSTFELIREIEFY